MVKKHKKIKCKEIQYYECKYCGDKGNVHNKYVCNYCNMPLNIEEVKEFTQKTIEEWYYSFYTPLS